MKEENYNPYKAAIESIAEICEKYGSFSGDTGLSRANDFLDNVRVKCKDATEYANKCCGETSGEQSNKDSVKDLCKTCSHYWSDFPLPLDCYVPHCEILDARGVDMTHDVVPYPCLKCPFGQYKEKPAENKQ